MEKLQKSNIKRTSDNKSNLNKLRSQKKSGLGDLFMKALNAALKGK